MTNVRDRSHTGACARRAHTLVGPSGQGTARSKSAGAEGGPPASSPGAMPLSYAARTVEWELLHWLLRCPFLRIADLARFCGVSRTTISRRLETADASGLVECVTPACLMRQGTERCYHLSDLGLRLLAAAADVSPGSLGRTWQTDERRLLNLLPRLSQLVRVQDAVAGIVVGAQVALGEHGQRVRGNWHWVRNYTHPFRYRERSMLLKVDAALVLQVTGRCATASRRHPRAARRDEDDRVGVSGEPGGWEALDRWHAALLLADHRVQDWDAGARALDAVLSYRECPERWDVYPTFPPLLILAQDGRHGEHWLQLARAVTTQRRLPALAGAVAVAPSPPAPSRPLTPWALAWHDLATGGQVHLTQVLAALPPAALPPGVNERGAPSPDVGPDRVISVMAATRRVIVGRYLERARQSVATSTSAPSANASQEARPARSARSGTTVARGARGLEAPERPDVRLLALLLGGRFSEILELLLTTPWIHLTDLADLLGMRLTSLDRYVHMLDRQRLLAWFPMTRGIARGSGRESGVMDESAGAAERTGHAGGRGRPRVQWREKAPRAHLSYSPDACVQLSPHGLRLATALQQISPRSRLARRAGAERVMRRETRAGIGGAAANGAASEAASAARPTAIGASPPARGRLAHSTGVFHFFALLARAADAAEEAVGRRERDAHGTCPAHLAHPAHPGVPFADPMSRGERLREVRPPPAARLVWWEAGPACECRYRYQGRWHNFRPDGAGIYAAGARRLRFWLEWDLGSMNLGDLTRKFAAYATYVESGQWRETAAPDRVLPHLLVVVQGLGQMDRMRRAAAAVFATRRVLVDEAAGTREAKREIGVPGGPSAGAFAASISITLAHRLDDAGPLAPIWWPLLPGASPDAARDGGLPGRRSPPRRVFPLPPPAPADRAVAVRPGDVRL